MLTLADVLKDCPLQRGLQLDDVVFNVVYSNPELPVSKGLYLPLSLNSEENTENLKQALYQGAIATFWRKEDEMPAFLPTHFPVFLVDNPLETIEVVVNNYIQSYKLKGSSSVDTKFSFSVTIKHIDDNMSYANSVRDKLEELTKRIESINSALIIQKEGGEEQW
ncbi:hypothetical protein [Bacillus sp. AK128]